MIDTKTGAYTCSDDLPGEIGLYTNLEHIGQQAIDLQKRINPDWSENQLHDYVDRSSVTHILPQIESCIASHGYDISSLPHIIVPEFPGEARGLVMLAMGAVIGYKKIKDWKSENQGSSYKDLVKSGYRSISGIVSKLRGSKSTYI